jgi:hypothetical protein
MLLCAALLVVAASPTLANRGGYDDGNDAFGPLDVNRMSHGHRGGRLLHKLTMTRDWQKKDLRDDYSDIHVLFTTDSDNKPERALVVDLEDGQLVGVMHRWAGGVRDQVFGRATVWRATPRTLKMTFHRSLLGAGVRDYGYHVDTRFHDGTHPRCNDSSDGKIIICPDWAPNGTAPRAYVRHRR